jgi:serine/threonine protein kinase
MIGEVLDAKYRIDKQLGAGGMGKVYLATHIGTTRVVAVKVIAPRWAADPQFHVHSAINLAGLRSRIVPEDFHHQGRVVRENDARLQHAQKPDLPLGLTERSRGVDRHVRVQPLAHRGHCRKSGADFERDASEDQLLAAGRFDGG